MKVSVLVPVYNEKETIEKILAAIKAQGVAEEIIIVDDGSTDSTTEFLRSLKDPTVKVFFHPQNFGKGAALRTAIKKANGDIIIFQDADLEYDPAEYKSLIQPIASGMADVVYGSRLAGGKPQRFYMYWHKLGNGLLSFLVNILYNTTLTDMETGYKVFKAAVIKDMKLNSNDFAIEAEITAKVFKNKLRIYELPISYYGRTYKVGKKITWRDGFAAIWTILKYRFID